MARIRHRGKSWHVEIRRTDAPPVCKSFPNREEAEAWAVTEEENVLVRRARKPQKELLAGQQVLRATAGDIVNAAAPFHSGSGIYVLIDGRRIVYVGKARNVLTRLLQHEKNGRPFTHYLVIPCQPEDMAQLEREVIARFEPTGNRQHAPRQRPSSPESRASA